MREQPSRRPTINVHDDALWNRLAREAASRLPDDLLPPLSEVTAPSQPEPILPTTPAIAETAAPETRSRARKGRKPKTTRYLNITRIDHKRTHGYYVRVRWKHVTRSKMFSDGKYGDRLSALAAAIEWRDRVTRELGKPANGKVSKSATIGVHRRIKDGRDVFEATWYEDGRHRRTTYSVAKHGVEKAKALAVAARQQALQARLEREAS